MSVAALTETHEEESSDLGSWDTSDDERPVQDIRQTSALTKTSRGARTIDPDDGAVSHPGGEARPQTDEELAQDEGEDEYGDDDVEGEGEDQDDDEMEGALTNAADLRERQMSHDSASGSDSEHEKAPGDTTENVDNKAASFARAFAKIISSAGTQKGILSASKTVGKRKREEAEEAKAERQAKALRKEMRRRGHMIIPSKGSDPEHDAKEKALSRIATRGVVRLFNAVAKAQKQQKEAAEGPKHKAPAISKAAFLAELQGQAVKTPKVSEQLVPSKPATARSAGVAAAAVSAEQGTKAGSSSSGWAVLQQDGIVGALGTGTRLKDWDQLAESEDEDAGAEAARMQAADSGDSDGDW